jgi:hypothetical protein
MTPNDVSKLRALLKALLAYLDSLEKCAGTPESKRPEPNIRFIRCDEDDEDREP